MKTLIRMLARLLLFTLIKRWALQAKRRRPLKEK